MASLARITGAEVHFDKHIHQGDDTEFSRDISINDKGFCICHPDIQLRKKGTFGGWTILKETCPKCDKIFELELEREKLENMKFATDSGLAAEVGKTDLSNIPSEMVKWMQTLELPEAANNEILLILCGNEIGMTKLISISIKQDDFHLPTPEVLQEQNLAIYDLEQSNFFQLVGFEAYNEIKVDKVRMTMNGVTEECELPDAIKGTKSLKELITGATTTTCSKNLTSLG